MAILLGAHGTPAKRCVAAMGMPNHGSSVAAGGGGGDSVSGEAPGSWLTSPRAPGGLLSCARRRSGGSLRAQWHPHSTPRSPSSCWRAV